MGTDTPRDRGRFRKKSGAGVQSDAGAPEPQSSGAVPVESGAGVGASHADTLTVAHPPGLNGAAVDHDTPASLEAEARAAVAGAPLDLDLTAPAPAGAPAPGQPSPEEVEAGYTMICGELVDVAAVALVPAWKVTPAESGKLAGAMARALLLWFPDMIIPPKYLALIAIAGVGFEIAQARKDPATGRYLPGRLPESAPAESAPAPSSPAPH